MANHKSTSFISGRSDGDGASPDPALKSSMSLLQSEGGEEEENSDGEWLSE